jgi:hypothetical protein
MYLTAVLKFETLCHCSNADKMILLTLALIQPIKPYVEMKISRKSTIHFNSFRLNIGKLHRINFQLENYFHLQFLLD